MLPDVLCIFDEFILELLEFVLKCIFFTCPSFLHPGPTPLTAVESYLLDFPLHFLHLALQVHHLIQAGLQELHIEDVLGVDRRAAIDLQLLHQSLRRL